jgi:hypothetical protein
MTGETASPGHSGLDKALPLPIRKKKKNSGNSREMGVQIFL